LEHWRVEELRMPHFARSRYGSTYIRWVFVLMGLFLATLSVLAYTSSATDRLALAGLALACSLASLLAAAFVKRLGAHWRTRTDYDPYGNLTTTSEATGLSEPYRYTGQYHDMATGLYKLGLRYYDPTLGRFTQQDPIGDNPTTRTDNPYGNRYIYTGCNPVNLTDPSGAATACDVAVATLGVVSATAAVGAVVATGGVAVGVFTAVGLSTGIAMGSGE
jgi:RHS repeat-associated protein